MKFYYVNIMEGYALAYYDLQESINYECEKCGAIYLSKRVGKYRTHFEGKKLGDFYRAPGCYIGNKKFIDMLEKYKITGYKIGELDCTGWYDRRKNIIEVDTSTLREIEITGKCGYMCDVSGNEIEKCDKCGQIDFYVRERINGLSVPLDTWDGSDIFSFENWKKVMVCSERLKEACEKENIKNISFLPIEEFTFV